MTAPSEQRRRRVLHLIDTGGPGGAETVFLKLAAAFRDRGWSSKPCVSREGWLAQQLRAAGLDPIIVESRDIPGRQYLASTVHAVRELRPDLILAHLFGASVYAALAGLVTRTPVISVLHGSTDLAGKHRGLWLKCRALRACDTVVFVAESLRDELEPALRLPASKAMIIPNGVDVQRFQPGTDSNARRELGVEPGAVSIGAVGNIRGPKAYDVLIDAADLVLQREPTASFVVAGEGPPEALRDLESRVQRHGIGTRFRFLGHVADTARLLRTLDVFVMSSRSEGLPLACLEAMASGLPVVSTRCGGPERVISPGVEGLLVTTDDPDALARALLELARAPERRAAMGRAGREKVVATFSEAAMTEAYFGLADRIVSG